LDAKYPHIDILVHDYTLSVPTESCTTHGGIVQVYKLLTNLKHCGAALNILHLTTQAALNVQSFDRGCKVAQQAAKQFSNLYNSGDNH
jgi:hypothetical protein